MSKMDPEQAMLMIEDMAINQREWTAEWGGRAQTTPEIMKVDEVTALQAQMKALQHQIAHAWTWTLLFRAEHEHVMFYLFLNWADYE